MQEKVRYLEEKCRTLEIEIEHRKDPVFENYPIENNTNTMS